VRAFQPLSNSLFHLVLGWKGQRFVPATGRIVAGILAWGLISQCSPGTPGEASGKSEQQESKVFRYNEPTGIATLDPAFAREQATLWTARHLFSTLIELDSALQPRPLLAKSWSQSADGSIRFVLRPDVDFHRGPGLPQGRRVVASDVVYSLERLRSPSLAAPGAWVLDGLERLSAPNDSVVELRFAAGGPSPFGLLSMPYCSVVPRESVEALGADFGKRPVGSGPFRFQAWNDGEKLVLRRNTHYFLICTFIFSN